MEQFIGFWDLTKKQQERLAADGMLNIRTFGKRQVLMNQDDDADNVGIMLSGTAFLESMNQEGQRRILDYYEPKESFARKCFPDVEGVCYVISRSSCQVAFLNDRKLSSAYKKYEKRGQLLEEILMGTQKRALMHADVLGQKTLRQKLMTYFQFLKRQKGRDGFSLPFSYTDCADYLFVDRSAMMRELGRMKEEGLIRTEGKKIWLEEKKLR